MLEYKIKKIKSYQYNKLSKILVKSYFKTFTNKELSYPSVYRDRYLFKLRDLKSFIRKNECEIFVAVSKNKVLGGVFYNKNLNNYGLRLKSKAHKTSSIRYLVVDTKYSGNSIGKALVKKCITQTKKDKNKRLILHTLDTMKEATFIYEKLEFKRYERLDFYFGNIFVKGHSKSVL